ncbi:glycosyl transferase family protein [Saccharobesus litoralis]|uniref:Glycosyl transferase family protein n=1 Tax=Saccharobesus litoralis TaxID=2172099 RepID=A0A2S0VRQ7_9ALTE|nr:glycosyl transferase family protein [Saccharobesus litoralis]AWB66905.1 glycosyl transferase family protein [Saccharobesus litoralis]
MAEPFKNYIKAVGKGHKAGRYLTQLEAEDAMAQMLSGQATPEQLGALLMLLRVREESVEELAGFLTACRSAVKDEFKALDCVDLDLGCYAGKRRHLPWFVLAVVALAQSGVRVMMHGTAEPESKRLYLKQVFGELGWPIASNAQQVQTHIAQQGFAYVDLQDLHPQLDELIQLRALFGLRSCTNTLARMLNPTGAKNSFHGVFHKEFDARHAEVAAQLKDNNVSCIRGEGGETEVNPERECVMHIARAGQLATVQLPIMLEKWQIKPRELSSVELADFWRLSTAEQQAQNPYGYAAVIATLSSFLILIEKLDFESAQQKALSVWQARQHFPE